ncbi:hypothetical protein Hanom_Chr12g01147401 [Helianthus anomalus]
MRGEVLPIIPLSCLRAGGDRVSAHLGEPRGWWRSSSRPWPQRPVSRWLTRRSLPFKKKIEERPITPYGLINFLFFFAKKYSHLIPHTHPYISKF